MENPATTLGRTVNERIANIVEFLAIFYATIVAILTMGIAIEHMVFLPRLLGMVLSFLGLAIFANLAAVFGGYYLARLAGVTAIPFSIEELLAGIEVKHFNLACIKVCIFGVVI